MLIWHSTCCPSRVPRDRCELETKLVWVILVEYLNQVQWSKDFYSTSRRCAAWVQHDTTAAPCIQLALRGLRTLEAWPTRLPRQWPCHETSVTYVQWKLSSGQYLIVCWWSLFGWLATTSGAGSSHGPRQSETRVTARTPPWSHSSPLSILVYEQVIAHTFAQWGKDLGGVDTWVEV